MTLQNRLKNNLVRRIYQLSTEKLNEVSMLLSKLGSQESSKELTKKMAGTWETLDDELLKDFTTNLHDQRGRDRQIN